MPNNTAAWLTAKYTDLEVGAAPYTQPRANEIVVKNRAVAINPVDWLKPYMGNFRVLLHQVSVSSLGTDCAGEVVEVGPGVTRFKVGDRVVGQAAGIDPKRNRPAEGAFQAYTVLSDYMASPIPDGMSFEKRCGSAPGDLDRVLWSFSERPASASAPDRARQTDRPDAPHLGRFDERGELRHSTRGRGRL